VSCGLLFASVEWRIRSPCITETWEARAYFAAWIAPIDVCSAVPIENGRTIDVGIEVVVIVRPGALSDDEVRNAVAIDIGNGGAMKFREGDATGVRSVVIVHDHVLNEGDISVCCAFLLESGQASAVGFERSDDVVQPVAVDVSDANSVGRPGPFLGDGMNLP
jgi:hypothetical protein